MKKGIILFGLIVLTIMSVSCRLDLNDLHSVVSGTASELLEQVIGQEQEPVRTDLFTVNSEGKQVVFSCGALYWDGESFKMEENQYDFRTWSGNKSVINGVETTNGTPTGHTGLFYWSKDVDKTYAQNYDSTGRTTADEFAFANGGAIEGWDVLNRDEWEYLLTRKDEENNSKYGYATITTEQGASVEGFVLLPDNWILPDGYNWTAGNGSWTTNNYNAEQWADMEQAGAVFLPAMGYREGSSIKDAGSFGCWWASTPSSSNIGEADYLCIYSGYVFVDYSFGYHTRHNGMGVRLVMPVEN